MSSRFARVGRFPSLMGSKVPATGLLCYRIMCCVASETNRGIEGCVENYNRWCFDSVKAMVGVWYGTGWKYYSDGEKHVVHRSVFAGTMAGAPVDTVWVFGYGSLCWNPGFTFEDSAIGYVKGFSRKFWQGSTSHRGTEEQPGRVATLIEDDDAIVWGRAFKVTEDSTAYGYLEKRECSNGGYIPAVVMFYPNGDETRPPIKAVTFIAYEDNQLWLGDAPLMDISSQIVNSKGIAGYNAEYVLKLADFMRRNVPQETDSELFALEVMILDRIQKQKLSLQDVMNGSEAGIELENEISRRIHDDSSNEFANRVPDKKLRCVNI